MTQEDKQLLFVDLCGRLPYGLKVHYKTAGWEDKNHTLSPQVIDNFLIRRDVIVKPYLRPMSSITHQELNLLVLEQTYASREDYMVARFDWLNAHHFDYRGLIEQGLAISTEVFNPYKD